MFLTMIDFGAAEMEKTVNKIQETVGRTLEEVKAHLVDLENEPFLDRVEMGKE